MNTYAHILLQIIRKYGLEEGMQGTKQALHNNIVESEKHLYTVKVLTSIMEDFDRIITTTMEAKHD